MTDKKLTDSEIVKALECCTQGRDIKVCWDCPLYVDLETARECCEKLNTNARDLINRLQAENERLKKAKYIFSTVDYCADDLDKALKENEELKSAINGFRGYEDKIKAEAYKECVEKVKEIIRKYCGEITEDDLDNILKELVGE